MERRYLNLNVYLRNSGYHEAAWRVSPADPAGTPENLAQLMIDWREAGACDGFTLMPNVLPGQLAAFVDHVVPILQKRDMARTEYAGTTLRDHVGLPRPAGWE